MLLFELVWSFPIGIFVLVIVCSCSQEVSGISVESFCLVVGGRFFGKEVKPSLKLTDIAPENS